MDMVSMKRDVVKEYTLGGVDPTPSPYPYGLSICLDEDSIGKLGLIALPMVGEKMTLTAKVEVRGVSMSESAGRGKDRRVELQITDMALGASDDEPEETDHAKVLYEMEDM
jgi:hypothetical protein